MTILTFDCGNGEHRHFSAKAAEVCRASQPKRQEYIALRNRFEERKEQILKMREEGKTYAVIAQAVGLSESRVQQVVTRPARVLFECGNTEHRHSDKRVADRCRRASEPRLHASVTRP